VAPVDGGAARRLTELKGLVHELAFSGWSKLAFVYVEARPGLRARLRDEAAVGRDWRGWRRDSADWRRERECSHAGCACAADAGQSACV